MMILPSVLFGISAVGSCVEMMRGAGQVISRDAPSVFSAQQGSISQAQRNAYQKVTSSYRVGPLRGAPGDTHQIQLQITEIECGDGVSEMPAAVGDCQPACGSDGYAVSRDATVSSFRYTQAEIQGGGPEPLPAENFSELAMALRGLPDDEARLPPMSRRVIFQVAAKGAISVRVYDRADLPDAVLQIFRVIGADIRPVVMDFEPDPHWGSGRLAGDESALAAIHPDAIRFTMRSVRNLAVSPDRSLVVVQTIPPALDSHPVTPLRDAESLKEEAGGSLFPDLASVLQIRERLTGLLLPKYVNRCEAADSSTSFAQALRLMAVSCCCSAMFRTFASTTRRPGSGLVI